jgi:MtrB/PioB family decaheme-associated outer membrane protein
MKTKRPNAGRGRRSPSRKSVVAAAALAATGISHEALADSAVGVETALGNQINPTGLPLGGLATGPISNIYENSRTPSGLLYPRAPRLPALVQSKTDPDTWRSAWAEVGYLANAGTTGTATFREYGDFTPGAFINNAGFHTENHKTARYFSVNAGAVGRADQYYRVNFGKYGTYGATAFFDSTPHVFSTNSKILWSGAGTGSLELPNGLTPGASTIAQVEAAFRNTPLSEVKLTRDKAGFAMSYTPSERYEAYFRLSNEWRQGARGIGATFGMPNRSGVTELVEPIDYKTIDVAAGLRYKTEKLQANLSYVGSFFRNDTNTLIWENPGLTSNAAGSFIPQLGRMPLAPSNTYNTVKGDVAWVFSPKVRFAGSASYAGMRQNADLLPPTISSGTIRGQATGAAGNINLSNWNTTAALSQRTAGAALDTYNIFAQVVANPMQNLRLNFEVRGRGEDNKTNYLALNPLTGQYGYIALDGGLSPGNTRFAGVYEPGTLGSRVQIRNIPFARDYLDMTGRALYTLANRDKIQLTLTKRSIHNDRREVVNTDDNRVAAQYSSRAHEWGTYRFTYEYADLTGSEYNPYPYAFSETTTLPGYVPRFPTGTPPGDAPFTLNEFRKYDVANRTQHVAKAQTNFILSEKLDVQFTGDYRSDQYKADYGLRNADVYNINAAAAYNMSVNTSFNAYYSYQGRSRNVRNIASGTLIASGAAGSSSYPLANTWTATNDDMSHVAGGGIHHQMDNVVIDINYTYLTATSIYGYTYASAAALSGGVSPAVAGNGFPDAGFVNQVLETNVLWNYTENIGIRGYYRLENERIGDFHYTGMTNVINRNIYLGAIPQNYTAHVIGMFFQFKY